MAAEATATATATTRRRQLVVNFPTNAAPATALTAVTALSAAKRSNNARGVGVTG
jgi:hypothetical protein